MSERKIFARVLAALLCRATGCNRQHPGAGPSATSAMGSGGRINAAWGIDLINAPGTTFQATLADGVERIDAGTVNRTIKGVTRDHDIFIFENVPELRNKLAPGKVVLFEGLAFNRIQAIAIDDSQLIVATQEASLTDLFKDANIQWKVPI